MMENRPTGSGLDPLAFLAQVGEMGQRAEATRRASDQRQAFLLKLTDALRPLADPVKAQERAMKLLAEHLGGVRASYFEMDPDEDGIVRKAGYEADSMARLPDRMRLSDFGAAIAVEYGEGRTVVVADTESEPRFEAQRMAYREIGVRAWVGVLWSKTGDLLPFLVSIDRLGAIGPAPRCNCLKKSPSAPGRQSSARRQRRHWRASSMR